MLKNKLADTDKKVLVFHGLADREFKFLVSNKFPKTKLTQNTNFTMIPTGRVHHQHTIALTEILPHKFVSTVFYANQNHAMSNIRDYYDVMGKSREFVLQCFKDAAV